MEIKGGCLCGAVRYTAETDPTSATVCHCRDCQKFTRSAFAALVRVPKEALTIEGTFKTFSSLGGSGRGRAANVGEVSTRNAGKLPRPADCRAGSCVIPVH
jgi:Glutathione-dependent formaldehyde-activating enzyme